MEGGLFSGTFFQKLNHIFPVPKTIYLGTSATWLLKLCPCRPDETRTKRMEFCDWSASSFVLFVVPVKGVIIQQLKASLELPVVKSWSSSLSARQTGWGIKLTNHITKFFIILSYPVDKLKFQQSGCRTQISFNFWAFREKFTPKFPDFIPYVFEKL